MSRQLTLTQGIREGLVLPVRVALYNPLPNDKTGYEWKAANGSISKMEMPTYCVVNIEEAKNNMREFAVKSSHSYLFELIDWSDLIVCNTLKTAQRLKVKELCLKIYIDNKLAHS